MKGARKKELRDQRIEFRMWKRWRRERLEALLNGPYAEPASALIAFCKTRNGPSALIDFVAASPWSGADADVRHEVLSFIDAVVVKRREQMNMPPFDDSLPGRPENVFLILRARLS